jgi:hypothetical protein
MEVPVGFHVDIMTALVLRKWVMLEPAQELGSCYERQEF